MVSHIVNPGRLRHTLYIQETTKSFGNPGPWANIATRPELRCSIDNKSGSEPTGRSGERAERVLVIEARYRSDLTMAHRLSDGGSRVFDIVSIDNVDEMDSKLIIEAVERRA